MSIKVQRYSKKASRFEFCCIRFIYMIPWAIIGGFTSMLLGILISFSAFLNFWTILIGGSRFEPLYKNFVKAQAFAAKSGLYFIGAAEERPPLHPF